MKINRNNYEVFFIDYYDGNLTTARQLELELFLDSNPDLKAEFKEFESIEIHPSNTDYKSKSELKKPEITKIEGISEDNYEEYFIAWYENDLSQNEKALLWQFLEVNQHLKSEFELHRTLYLPQERIVFENKESLKKRSAIFYYWSAAAAILILFSAGYFFLQNQTALPEQRFEIAGMEKATISVSVNDDPSDQLILQQKDLLVVSLPAPESLQTEKINSMASVNLASIYLQEQLPIYILEAELTNKPMLMAAVEQPKERGWLAQFFKRNVEEFTTDFGINSSSEIEQTKKKDPGFVKFLDGSLAIFNTLTGSDTELVKSYDQEGNLSNYSLVGQTLLVNRSVSTEK